MKYKKLVTEMIKRNLIREFYTDDMKFVVYSSRLKSFLDELKKHKHLKLINKEKDGGYFNVKVINNGPADSWDNFIEFYKNKIKI